MKHLTDRKIKDIYLSSSCGWHPGGTTKASFVGSYATDDWGNTWQREVEKIVPVDCNTVDEVIAALRAAAEGLTEVTVRTEYGELRVSGFRPVTPEEEAEVMRFLAFQKQEEAQREANDRAKVIAQAKKLGIKPEDLK